MCKQAASEQSHAGFVCLHVHHQMLESGTQDPCNVQLLKQSTVSTVQGRVLIEPRQSWTLSRLMWAVLEWGEIAKCLRDKGERDDTPMRRAACLQSNTESGGTARLCTVRQIVLADIYRRTIHFICHDLQLDTSKSPRMTCDASPNALRALQGVM